MKAGRIGILFAQGKERSHGHGLVWLPLGSGWPLGKTGAVARSPCTGRLVLGLDHLGHQGDGIGV